MLDAATNAFYGELEDLSEEATAGWRQTLELITAMRRN